MIAVIAVREVLDYSNTGRAIIVCLIAVVICMDRVDASCCCRSWARCSSRAATAGQLSSWHRLSGASGRSRGAELTPRIRCLTAARRLEGSHGSSRAAQPLFRKRADLDRGAPRRRADVPDHSAHRRPSTCRRCASTCPTTCGSRRCRRHRRRAARAGSAAPRTEPAVESAIAPTEAPTTIEPEAAPPGRRRSRCRPAVGRRRARTASGS